ncbi:hypothetical protein QQF64_006967 [Cirrhinus molitorella]|uniref:Uncharacterized protein n=1 Tax=Cirrhinus molitorella TaxID=172907 RepID=A0ABR3MCQ6_9TELE
MFTSALFDYDIIAPVTWRAESPGRLSLIGLSKKSSKKLHEWYSNYAVVTPNDKERQTAIGKKMIEHVKHVNVWRI